MPVLPVSLAVGIDGKVATAIASPEPLSNELRCLRGDCPAAVWGLAPSKH